MAIKPAGSRFVVAYDSDSYPSQQVMVAEVSAADTVTTYDAGQPRFRAAVSIDGYNNYVVIYKTSESCDAIACHEFNIHTRRGHLD